MRQLDERTRTMRRRDVPRFIFRAITLIGFLSISASAQEVKVDLPRGFRNAVPTDLDGPAVVLAIPKEHELYLNGKRVAESSLGGEINRLIQAMSERPQIVYLACGASIRYGVVIETLNLIRAQDFTQIGLVVDSAGADPVIPKMFLVEVPGSRIPDGDLSKLKPNPLTLVAAISSDRKLTLNHDSGPQQRQLCFSSVPGGLGTDPMRLERWLECLFENRTQQRAYAIGMETRGDLPLSQRIEKTVFVKAARSLEYGDVVRVIDAVKGSGAHPVGLQIDGLPE